MAYSNKTFGSMLPMLVQDSENARKRLLKKCDKEKENVGKNMKRKSEKIAMMSSAGNPNKKYKIGNKRDGDVREMWKALVSDDDSGSEHGEHSPKRAPRVDDDEINELLKMGGKKPTTEKSPKEIALLVENVMARLEVAAEDDTQLNRQGKPAFNKLKKLPFLIHVLSKKQLQREFIHHGVLTLLNTWLEPLPDGSLPNATIREALIKIATDLPIFQNDMSEHLKKSGLGKVMMFLSKFEEETISNKRLAKELVKKWSQSIFSKTTSFDDETHFKDKRIPYRSPITKKPTNKSGADYCDSDEEDIFSSTRFRKCESRPSSFELYVSIPEPTSMDFVFRPKSKINPKEIINRAREVVPRWRRIKINKKLQEMKSRKKKRLQATVLNVAGCGMLV